MLLLLVACFDARGAQVALSWQDNSNNETGFKIERATGSGAYAQIGTTAANVTNYTDTTVAGSATYHYRVYAYNASGNSGYSNVATATTNPAGSNSAPTISDIASRTINEDTSTGAIPFTVGDAETTAGSLTISGSSSNTALVPNTAVTFGGSGASRTVTIVPAANQSGAATITVSVSDGTLTTTDIFVVTVAAANDAPTISNIASRTITEDANSGAIAFTVGDVETAGGSLTISATSSNSILVPNAAIALGGSGANRTITVTPAANQNGSATITVTVSDGILTATDTFVVTVAAVNDAPTLTSIADQAVGAGGVTGALAFAIGDEETAASALAVSAISSNGTLVPDAAIALGGSGSNRSITLAPAVGESGTAAITIFVSDGLLTTTETFTLTVTAVANATPTISEISSRSINENATTGPIAFTIDDAETPATSLVVTATSSNTTLVPHAALVLGGSGASRTIAVTPTTALSGIAIIAVTVSDGYLTTTEAFSVTVEDGNEAPTISNIANQTIAEDGATSALAFTVSDSQTAATDLTISRSSSNTTLLPTTGIVLGGSDANRTVTIRPAPNQNGVATVTITVSDGLATATDTITVTVTAVNDTPTITNIANQSTSEDTATAPIAFVVGDAETATTSLVVAGSSSNTTLVPNAGITLGGSGANRTVTITPAANQTGTATITLTVSDGAASATDTLTLTVSSVNDAPTITAIADQTISENSATALLSFIIGDAETPAASLTVTGLSSNTALVPLAGISFGGTGANRIVAVTPAANKNGIATITVIVGDGAASTSRSFALTVTAVNDAPAISNIANQSTNEDTATAPIAFVIGDAETATASLLVSGSSSNTTLVPNAGITFGGSGANRTIKVTPAANQTGTATITVTVSDGMATATDTFTLTVGAVNDGPTITTIAAQMIPEDTTTTALAFVIGDAETPVASLTVTGLSSNTALVPLSRISFGGTGANRTVTVAPAADQNGAATITVTVSDGTASTSRTFDLVVIAVNDAPTISNIANQSTSEGNPTAPITFVIGDAETATTSLVLSGSSSNAALVSNAGITFGGSGANRTITVTPATNQTGTATITVTVSDGAVAATAPFILTVSAVNDAPTITAIADQTITEDSATAALAFTIGDAETAAASLTVTGHSSNNALVPLSGISFGGSGANRTVTVTPAADQSGVATITVTVTDGTAATSGTFGLAVSAGNDAPTITDIENLTIIRDTTTGALDFTVGDAETAAASLTVSGTSSNTTLVPNASVVFGGSGADRTVRITPAAGQSGTATITLTVSDGTTTATDIFVLTVAATNTAPSITNIPSRVVAEDVSTGPISFIVTDAQTAASSLTLSAKSSDTTLVPPSAIVFGGTGTARTVTVTPAANLAGKATITVTVSDGALTASDPFTFTVNAVNDSPTISDLPNRTISPDASTGAIAFTIDDAETTAASLTVSGTSSNTTLVPNSAITFGGSGGNRTVTLTPAAGRTGTATITISVRDATSTGSDSFVLNVTSAAAANQPPTITPLPDRAGHTDRTLGPITFIVADQETATASLSVFAASSNPTLIPSSGIALGGAGATRTVTLRPATGQTGSTTITLTVSDGTNTASEAFTVTIGAGARLLNLSTRVVCRPSRESLIPGFVVSGTANRRVLLRAVGPTLSAEPFNVPGALPNPRIVLKRWNGTAFVDVASNDNWSSNANASEIRQVAADLFAFAIPHNSLDAALLLDLPPGRYTVLADDASGSNGVVILELYDAETRRTGSDFINLSNRGYVGRGAEVMISGFVVSEEGPKTLLIRAVGPGLAAAPFNVPNTNPDPLIEIYRRNSDGTDTLMQTHDNWGEGGDAATIAELAAQVSAFGLATGSKDAACVETFPPGIYTAVVRGVDQATGTALVEIYSIE